MRTLWKPLATCDASGSLGQRSQRCSDEQPPGPNRTCGSGALRPGRSSARPMPRPARPCTPAGSDAAFAPIHGFRRRALGTPTIPLGRPQHPCLGHGARLPTAEAAGAGLQYGPPGFAGPRCYSEQLHPRRTPELRHPEQSLLPRRESPTWVRKAGCCRQSPDSTSVSACIFL